MASSAHQHRTDCGPTARTALSKDCCFLDHLPAVRYMIYRHALGGGVIVEVNTKAHHQKPFLSFRAGADSEDASRHFLALLSVCKTTRREARPILHRSVSVETSLVGCRALRPFRENVLAGVQSVSVWHTWLADTLVGPGLLQDTFPALKTLSLVHPQETEARNQIYEILRTYFELDAGADQLQVCDLLSIPSGRKLCHRSDADRCQGMPRIRRQAGHQAPTQVLAGFAC